MGPDGSLYYLARGSNSVYRVSFTSFTDAQLMAGVSVVRAVHVTELRLRINVQRTRFGLAAFSWTDPSLGAGHGRSRGPCCGVADRPSGRVCRG